MTPAKITLAALLGLCTTGLPGQAEQERPKPQDKRTPPTSRKSTPRYLPYGKYDVRKVLRERKDESGAVQHYLDLEYADRIFADLRRHAENYPPRFRSKPERARAERDVAKLAGIFEVLTKDPNMLLRAGRLHAIGHNLGIEGAAAKATRCFESILKLDPDHAAAHFHFGAFLASTATGIARGRQHLKRALKLGVIDASFSLAIVSLHSGNKKKAIEYLERYTKARPKAQRANQLLTGLRNGSIKVEPRTKK